MSAALTLAKCFSFGKRVNRASFAFSAVTCSVIRRQKIRQLVSIDSLPKLSGRVLLTSRRLNLVTARASFASTRKRLVRMTSQSLAWPLMKKL